MMFIRKSEFKRIIEERDILAKRVAEYDAKEKEKESRKHKCDGYCKDCEHSFDSDTAYYGNYGIAYARKMCSLDRECNDYKKKENENG